MAEKIKGLAIQFKKEIGVAVAAVAVLIVVISLAGGGYKRTVKDFMKAFEKSDAEKMIEIAMPKAMQEAYFDDEEELEDYIDMMDDSLDDLWDEIEDSDGKVEWKIKRAESLKKLKGLRSEAEDYGYDDIDDYRERMEDVYELDEKKIKKVYAVEIEMEVEMDDDTEENDAIIFVYKYKGKWYVDMASFYSLY